MFFFKLKWWWQLMILSLLSLAIYAPIIGNSFLNDDFIVIKRVCIDGQLSSPGFFRPLSDITIWLTFQLAGLHPWPYYLTGILIHGISVFLFMQLCLRWKWTSNEQMQQRFALLAAALFFCYPFHNEAVAWILGRGALVANTLGITALLILVSSGKDKLKMPGVCACYFVGLTIYETVIVLPAMIFIYLVINKVNVRTIMKWMGILALTLLLHLLLRFGVAGSLAGDYGANFFNTNWKVYVSNSIKALGRVVLPPSDNSQWMTVCSLLFFTIMITVFIAFRKYLSGNRPAARFFYIQLACFLLAMIIPAVAGVSTRTSESDRFLHLPSYFIVSITAMIVVVLLQASKWFSIVVTVMLCLQIFLLEKNNLNWRKASVAVTGILKIAQKSTSDRSLYIIDLPEEINGAFVFRAGFKEALMVNNIDTAKVHVLNKLSRDEELLLQIAADGPLSKFNKVLFPAISKTNDGMLLLSYGVSGEIRQKLIPLNSKVVYWYDGKWTELN